MSNYSKEQNKNSPLREIIQSSLVYEFNRLEMEWDESIKYQLSIRGTEINNHIDNILYFLTNCKSWNEEQLIGMMKFELYSTWGDGFPAEDFDYKECVVDIISKVNMLIAVSELKEDDN